MKQSSRYQTTIDVLNIIQDRKLPMDLLIGDFMRNRRFIGSKDRADIVERLYNMTRHYARLGWWLDKVGMDDTPRTRVIAYIMLCEDGNSARIKDMFDGEKYAPDLLSNEELTMISALQGQPITHDSMPDTVKTETPDLYADKLQAKFGDDFTAEMNGFMEGATLDLRVNIYRSNLEKVSNYLEADGVQTTPTPYSPWGLRVEGKAYLSRTKAFSKGWIDIQDEGSQLVALACDAQPGMQVLDYCAGAGGKSLALGAAMGCKGRIVAMDTDARRLNKSKPRFKKAGLADMVEIRPMSDEKHKKWLRRQKGTFDIVLCDVPCTGTGTWRRNPDMRWSVYGPSLEELTVIQADILDKVAKAVKPGGKLVYATCSILPDENENQIAAFLARHDGEFKIGSYPEVIPTSDLNGLECMSLTPHQHNTDGFFTCVLERV